MENDAYLSINTFGIIIFSIVILLLLIYSAIMTWHFFALAYIMKKDRYKMLSSTTVMGTEKDSYGVWSLKDAVKREKLLAKFEKLNVHPPENVTFSELVPTDERGENPIQKMLS